MQEWLFGKTLAELETVVADLSLPRFAARHSRALRQDRIAGHFRPIAAGNVRNPKYKRLS